MKPEPLIDLAETAAMHGEYEAAYHLVMAALHLADHRRDAAAVKSVSDAGRRFGAAIEAVVPPHRLSRQQAEARGQPALFDQLEIHADAVRLRLHSEELKEKAA